jgi:hypothetical protein
MTEQTIVDSEAPGGAEEPLGEQGGKRAFVEPEVSFPIDVLESTTFFQFTESNTTN